MHFYLTTNDNRREPEAIYSVEYVHVKAKGDGSQTVIITEDEIIDPACAPKTQEEAQAILDAWIDEENETPTQDLEGNDIVQRRITLESYLAT